MDQEVNNQFAKIKTPEGNQEEIFPEHEFVASCLRIGMTIKDLEELTYIDCLKILLSFINTQKEDTESVTKATQKDIDRLLG